MIIRHVLANDPRFKGNRVEFKTGLNVVLADRHHAAGDQDTTNGAGKTTLLEIMQYCLGKDVSKDKRSIFHEPELLGWEFSLVISDEGRDVTFTRPVGPRSQITVESSDQVTGFPELGPNGKVTLSRNAFADSAGSFFFGLLPEFSGKYSPRFRSLISYFIRVGKEAYNRPFVHHRKQSEWDEQVSTTYLLRLNSDLASRWQVLRDREQRLKLLKQLAKTKDVTGRSTLSRAALFSKVTRLRAQAEREEAALRTFRVHEQYSDWERQANLMTEQIHRLLNENIMDEQLLSHYEETATQETPADISDVEAVYQELGITFPDHVRRRLDEVKAFHDAVVKNRRNFVQREIERLRKAIADRATEIKRITEDRADIMKNLESYGALQDFAALQAAHAKTLEDLAEAERAYKAELELDEENREIKRLKGELFSLATTDRREREQLLEEALLRFTLNSAALYPEPGDLLIDITESGYKFGVQIDRERSQGVSNMMIFCYDLMLMQLPRFGRFPRFLVHDSLVFDGVDFRQRAKALELVAMEAERLGFQYICTMNRDEVPWNDFSPGFADKFRNSIRLELSDQADGGLLGFQIRAQRR